MTIAGSDSSGGAGIQADLKTFAAHGVYGMSIVTAVTAQNTLGVHRIHPIPSEVVAQQITAVMSDIPPSAIKIGMLGGIETILAVAHELERHRVSGSLPYIVLDPVFMSSSGRILLETGAIDLFINTLFPLVSLITPNTSELRLLCQSVRLECEEIRTEQDLLQAGQALFEQLGQWLSCPPAILCKGGHLEGDATDLLLTHNATTHWLRNKRIDNPNTHGTGCTLSAAIAANLAQGDGLVCAVNKGNEYMQLVIGRQLDLGQGNGPLAH